MEKSDKSIRNICIASIKRHTFKPIDYPMTKIFETEALSEINMPVDISHHEDELPVVLCLFDENNWTLVTTRKIISNISGNRGLAHGIDVQEWKFNDFKGYKDKYITKGELILNDGKMLQIVIETGYASMMMIYGIMTLMGQVQSR